MTQQVMTKCKDENQENLFYFSPRNWFFIILAIMICITIYSQQKKPLDRIATPMAVIHSFFR
jgi:hypothetical protein